MTDGKFIELAKQNVAEYTNAHFGKLSGQKIAEKDVYIVWYCKTLQNWKALAATHLPDGMYFEITLNGDRHELYVDAYGKLENKVVPVES